jgi:hypothetical protein
MKGDDMRTKEISMITRALEALSAISVPDDAGDAYWSRTTA